MIKIKVLLVRPQAPNMLNFTKILDNEPLELEYLYTGLKNSNISSYIFDGLVEKSTFTQVFIDEKPDVVAITGYITQQNLMLDFCKKTKSLNPKAVTIVGGVHAQLNYKEFYKNEVDYIYRSECVNDFVNLVNLIKNDMQTEQNLSSINGLCFRNKNGEFINNELVSIDINSLPIPDRTHFYKNISSYRYLNLTEVATMKTAFSCPYNCNFCYCTLLNSGKYQARNLDLVIEELKNLKCQNVQIVDDDFLVDKKRLWDFIDLVKKNNINKTYICYARADFISKNADIVKELADIGFKYFLVGLEAVNDEELENFNKQTTKYMNEKCISVINETSADCIGLMIAPIDADAKYFENMYNWIVKNNLKYVTVSMFTPIPGTPLYEEYKHKIISNDIEDWDFLHLVLEPTKLTKWQFYSEYNKLFLKLYKIAKDTGIYDFMNISFYKNMLTGYLSSKIKGGKI